jgi:formylglycine-generating enzyme required for sulfatase activity
MPGHHGGSSSSSSSSSSNSGPAGGASAGGNYGGNSSGGTSSNNMSNTGGGSSWSPASGSPGTTPSGTNVNTSSNNDDDNRLDYLSGAYQDQNLTTAQRETLANLRQQSLYAISPMSKPSNIAIGVGLNALIPGAGYLFGHYKNSTAMGYSMTNPLNGLTDKFGNVKEWIADKFGGLLDGSTGNFNTSTVGQGDNDRTTMNTLAPLAPYAVSETTPDVSQASKWYNSIGENTESTFNFAQAYSDAKTKVTNNLKNHGPLAQLAVSDSPYYNWLKTNKMDKGIL